MKQYIRDLIKSALAKLYPTHKDIDFSVDYAPSNIDADFASNIALILAKYVGRKSMDLAEEIQKNLKTGKQKNIAIEVAEPGFLNFKLSSIEMIENLNKILQTPSEYGKSDIGKNRLAIVEYFQLNVAKPPHIGHLRSAVIGDAIKRILSFLGFQAISDTHIGDWGTQLGIFIHALKNKSTTLRTAIIKDIKSSEKAYTDQYALIESRPELREAGKAEFALLEKGNPENRKYWKEIVKQAKNEVERSAKNLDLLPFDYQFGESFYQDKMPEIIKHLEMKNLLIRGETGEKYIDLEKYGLGRLIALKSDGATTYELRDLATLAYRYDNLAKGKDLAWNLYVVDSRQSHDFKQVFKTMEMLGYDVLKSKHIEFGYMSLPEGPISTRKGNVISLEKLIQEARGRALEIIYDKNPDLKNKVKTAQQVGLAAVKYFDLKHNRKSDIVFDWDKALSFEGNTGPYIQYTHARFCSILTKVKIQKKIEQIQHDQNFPTEQYELLRKLHFFPDVIVDSATEFMPSILANYLYELAEVANNFYHRFPVMREKDLEIKRLHLALVSATTIVLQKGLNLLGIESPEEM